MKMLLYLAVALLLIPVPLIGGGMFYDWIQCIRRDGWKWCDVFAVIAFSSLILGGWLLSIYLMGAFQ